MIIINSQPSTCPSCKKEEDIIEVCANCGYEYNQEANGPKWYEVLIFIGIALLLIWLFVTVISWLTDLSFDKNTTLFGSIKSQIKFIITAIHHIF